METYGFVGGHFVHQTFMRTCGKEHAVPFRDILAKCGALEELTDVLNRLNIGKKCVVIADLNTYEATGEQVMQKLHAASYTIHLPSPATVLLIRIDDTSQRRL